MTHNFYLSLSLICSRWAAKINKFSDSSNSEYSVSLFFIFVKKNENLARRYFSFPFLIKSTNQKTRTEATNQRLGKRQIRKIIRLRQKYPTMMNESSLYSDESIPMSHSMTHTISSNIAPFSVYNYLCSENDPLWVIIYDSFPFVTHWWRHR